MGHSGNDCDQVVPIYMKGRIPLQIFLLSLVSCRGHADQASSNLRGTPTTSRILGASEHTDGGNFVKDELIFALDDVSPRRPPHITGGLNMKGTL